MSTAYGVGAVALLQEGCLVWSKTRRDADDCPVGGLVVEVLDTPDPETGELRRSFRCLDNTRMRPRLTWHVLPEDDVDRSTAQAAATSQIANVVRRLCEEICMKDAHRRRTGLFMPEHLTLLHHAWRLAGLL